MCPEVNAFVIDEKQKLLYKYDFVIDSVAAGKQML